MSPAYGKNRLVFWSIHGNGDAVLICSNVLGTALKHLDINFKIKPMPAVRSLYVSNSGKTDGEIARVNGLEAK